jgi:hypothetical protein
MFLKKAIYILISLTLLFVSTSCSNSTVETLSETTIQTEVQTEPAIEYKTIEPPEGGWTLELLSQVTYLNGKQVNLPFSVKDLGDEYSFNSRFFGEETNRSIGDLYYNDNACLELDFQIPNGLTYSDELNFYNATYPSKFLDEDLRKTNLFVINGISIGSSFEDVVEAFGNYNKKDGNIYWYYLSNNNSNLVFLINNSNNSVEIISIG